MANKSDIYLPVVPSPFEPVQLDAPISRRENFLRAMRHEKPMWMPFHLHDSQIVASIGGVDGLARVDADGEDWFGVQYKYEPAQKTAMPSGVLLDADTIGDWRDIVKFPDLSQVDWEAEKAARNFVRDEGRALGIRLQNGMFERSHFLLGFEGALVALMTDPDEMGALFDRVADYKIELFNAMQDHYDFDYVIFHDDYGEEKDAFFSRDVFRDLLYAPLKKIVDAVHARGCLFMMHSCGKIGRFFADFVEMGVDAVEIQPINDIAALLDQYGDKITIRTLTDPYCVNDPDISEAELRARAREVVDQFGAQARPGAGIIFNFLSALPDKSHIFLDEATRYSLAQYAPLQS